MATGAGVGVVAGAGTDAGVGAGGAWVIGLGTGAVGVTGRSGSCNDSNDFEGELPGLAGREG